MLEIPRNNTFTNTKNIKKGMSRDEKYYIEDYNNKHFLFRISDIDEYD